MYISWHERCYAILYLFSVLLRYLNFINFIILLGLTSTQFLLYPLTKKATYKTLVKLIPDSGKIIFIGSTLDALKSQKIEKRSFDAFAVKLSQQILRFLLKANWDLRNNKKCKSRLVAISSHFL